MERGLTDDVSNNMATCHVEEMLGVKSRRLSAFQQAYEKEEKFERKFIKNILQNERKNKSIKKSKWVMRRI